MRILILIFVLLFSGCAHSFQPSGNDGSKTEYYWGKKICSICHKQCGFFKVMDKKKIVCADCFEKSYN